MGSERVTTYSYIGFTAVLLLFVSMAALYLYNLGRWISYPDFGFAPRTATGFNVVGRVTENGLIQGIRIGDIILEVNGKTFGTHDEFRAAMYRSPDGQNIYLVQRGEQQLSVTIVSKPLGFKRVFTVSGIPFLLGIAYAFIGVIVFLMKPHRRVSWVFYLFAAVFGLFLVYLARVGKLDPYWLDSLDIFTFSFVPAVFIHLAFSFPDERKIVKKYPYIQILPYVISCLLSLILFSRAATLGDEPKILILLVVTFLSAGVFFFLLSCVQLWIKSTSDMIKLRAKMILLGFGISASLPLVDFSANALFSIYIVPSFSYYFPFFIVFPLFVGYSIVKHDLFDIDAIIKRTYGYVLTTGVVAGSYGIFVLVTNVFFGRFELTKSSMFPLIFILAVVFFFNPVRNRVQRFIDRVFYRLEYDYQETVRQIGESMRSLLTLNEIGMRIMDTSLGTMFIDSGSLLIQGRQGKDYKRLIAAGQSEKGVDLNHQDVAASAESPALNGDDRPIGRETQFILPEKDPFIQKLSVRKKEVTIYDIQEDPFFGTDKDACLATLKRLDAILVVPLIYEDRLTGLMSLGRKKSGKFYRREDINLLNTLANQGAVAIENALLLEDVIEKERMEEELTIARDLQTSMLPATCPEIPGFEIAALSMSAKEVGGDFYDFVVIDDSQAGIVIGDVTGKSVSGALVMAASRSVFRMLSEVSVSVGEIMNRANRRLKQDVTSGMFVALLYGLLNGNDGTLRLCSAGQTQPVYVSSQTGDVNLVQTAGDTFPLGILDEVHYEETLIQLSPGDTLVLYTDGIVEAMNKEDEMFGFDRLLDIVRESQSAAAEEVLNAIIESVNEFCKGAPQHDDLTVIVIHASG
jgi:serine phosphatase RsbU (regulator of sigma subunit)